MNKTLNPFSKPMSIGEALSTPPPAMDHVLPGLLSSTVGAVVAPGGSGKTMLLLQLGIALASGTPLCGGLWAEGLQRSGQSGPQPVVLVMAEESCQLMQHRLHAVLAHLLTEQGTPVEPAELKALLEKNLRIYPLAGAPDAGLFDRNYDRTAAFDQLLEACRGARLIALDPLRQFHCGDENDSWAMTAVAKGAQHLATEVKAAVLLAHHTNRASTTTGTGDQAGAARGSTALTDGVRWQLNLSRPADYLAKAFGLSPSERHQMVQLDIAKANYLAPQRPVLLRRMLGGALTLASRPPSSGANNNVAGAKRRKPRVE